MNYWTQPIMKEKSGLKSQIKMADSVIEKVAAFYGMSNSDIRGKCRKRELVKARWIAMSCRKIPLDSHTTQFILVARVEHTG